MNPKLWGIFIMNEADAEPVLAGVRPFTRFDKPIADQVVAMLEARGVPARVDPVREEVVEAWISRSRRPRPSSSDS